MLSSRRVLDALVALPAVAATAAMLWVAVADRTAWAADRRVMNSAEAAALGNVADMVRFLDLGENPMRVLPVRPRFISSSIPLATTVEAALWSRSPELVRLLDERGALAGSTRRELACLAADLDLPEVVDYLDTAGDRECEPGAALARIVARATERTGL
jgi:hypothetical protein